MSRLARLAGGRRLLLAAAVALAAASLLIPTDGPGGSMLRACGLLGALLGAARALRPASGSRRVMSVLERESLGRGGGLALVEVDGHRLLLGWAPGGTTLIRDLGPGVQA